MAQPTRKQPHRACGDGVAPMDEDLWSELPADLVESILGHLPVHSLHRMVMAMNPHRWRQIFNHNDTAILHHHNHDDSAIGQLKSYWPTWLAQDSPFLLPAPRAFDHHTRQWQTLPQFSAANVDQYLQVRSVSEGLFFLVTPAGDYLSTRHPHRMVIWNPVLQSHRWIGPSPYPEQSPYFEALVVDREKRSYKVIEFLNPGFVRGTCPVYQSNQYLISRYTIYDSRSATWGAVQQSAPLKLSHSRVTVSCEGCVLFLTVAGPHTTDYDEVLRGVVCYDATAERWSEALFPESFLRHLPGDHLGCEVVALLYAAGRLLLIVKRRRNPAQRYFFIASIRMSDVREGVAAFQHVGWLQEKRGTAKSVQQAAPQCSSRAQPEKLVVKSPCGSARLHWWYVLPKGRTWYLCVEFRMRWIRQFNLEAMVWEDEVVVQPCEEHHDRGLVGWNEHQVDVHRHAYIPGWVKT